MDLHSLRKILASRSDLPTFRLVPAFLLVRTFRFVPAFLLVPTLLLVSLSTSAQFVFDLEQANLRELIQYEVEMGSNPTRANSTWSTEEGAAQPIFFTRKNEDIPDLLVKYFFYETDSSLFKITYEWDLKNFDDSPDNPQTDAFINAMLEQYRLLTTTIESQFDKSSRSNSNYVEESIDSRTGLHLFEEWETAGKAKIELHLNLRNQYFEAGISSFPTTHRIRLHIKKK